jgi:hypothetical protein
MCYAFVLRPSCVIEEHALVSLRDGTCLASKSVRHLKSDNGRHDWRCPLTRRLIYPGLFNGLLLQYNLPDNGLLLQYYLDADYPVHFCV